MSALSILVQVRTAGFKVEGEAEKAAALRSHLASGHLSWKRALGSSSQCSDSNSNSAVVSLG